MSPRIISVSLFGWECGSFRPLSAVLLLIRLWSDHWSIMIIVLHTLLAASHCLKLLFGCILSCLHFIGTSFRSWFLLAFDMEWCDPLSLRVVYFVSDWAKWGEPQVLFSWLLIYQVRTMWCFVSVMTWFLYVRCIGHASKYPPCIYDMILLGVMLGTSFIF